MYTSYIGQRLLALYNQRQPTDSQLTARQFFEQQLYPLFFEPSKYLQWVPNSPFAQAVAKGDLVPGGPSAAEIRLAKLHRNIETVAPDASFVIGFPAAGVEGTTSGQVSNVGPVVSGDEIYCSWIGGALGVGVSGGLSLLLDQDDVLWTLYEGWAHYRQFLNERPTLKGNQIDTWNGQWLAHAFGEQFDPDYPLDELDIKLTDTAGTLSMPTREWVQVLFALARQYPAQTLMAYVYSLAQTNRTIGFVPLRLGAINKVRDLHDKLFLFPTNLQSAGEDQLLRLYTTQFSFGRACQQGAIGLAAIEPAKLREYLTGPQGKPKALTAKTEESAIQFAFYQIWIIAMLNNQELYDAADQLAATLHAFTDRQREESRDGKRGKTTTSQQLEQVFVKHRPAFFEKLTELLKEVKAQEPYRSVFDDVVRRALLMPVDNFPLFIILTRFRYVARQSGAEATTSSEISPA
ncbi:hypothetical protein A0257_03465 [Hymenobacter psoromatis]|nr:hypothetical protein A0257_03465 [Hymenobacter psoromatis]